MAKQKIQNKTGHKVRHKAQHRVGHKKKLMAQDTTRFTTIRYDIGTTQGTAHHTTRIVTQSTTECGTQGWAHNSLIGGSINVTMHSTPHGSLWASVVDYFEHMGEENQNNRKIGFVVVPLLEDDRPRV